MQVRISNIESKANIRASVCVLPISVGQDYHEGEILDGTLKLVRANFAKCIVVVADTLQKYSFVIDALVEPVAVEADSMSQATEILTESDEGLYEADEKEQLESIDGQASSSQEGRHLLARRLKQATLQAKEAGDAWLKRNRPCIDECFSGFSYEILRWDECLLYAGFSEKLDLLEAYYKTRTSDFSRSVNKICGQRIARYLKNGTLQHSDIPMTQTLMKSYVCEEAAVMLEWRELGYQYMAYPSSHNPMNKEVFDCLGAILAQNSGMELLNIEILQQAKQNKKIKKQPPSLSVPSEDFSLTVEQRQQLEIALQDFLPLAINPIFTALRNLNRSDPALTLIFLRKVQEQILAIEEQTAAKNGSLSRDTTLVSSTGSSAMFHSLPELPSSEHSVEPSLSSKK